MSITSNYHDGFKFSTEQFKIVILNKNEGYLSLNIPTYNQDGKTIAELDDVNGSFISLREMKDDIEDILLNYQYGYRFEFNEEYIDNTLSIGISFDIRWKIKPDLSKIKRDFSDDPSLDHVLVIL